MKKVLLIDDDQGILDAVKAILEYSGYQVETTDDVNRIFKMKQQDLPGVILLDFLLSGNDGRKVAQDIRSNSITKSIPIIMLSAHPSASEAAKACGANDFLAKPFDMSELLDKINRLIT